MAARRPPQPAALQGPLLLLLVLVAAYCLSVARAFLLPTAPSSSLSLGPRAQQQSPRPVASIHDALGGSGGGLKRAVRVMNSSKDKGSKRRRRRQTKPEEGGVRDAAEAANPSSVGVGRYDPSLTPLIEDERKAALPRLEDLKRGKEAAAKGMADLPTGGTPGILLPRELEELKAKERAKTATKGAPPYFDLMTKVSWGGIAVLVIAEVVVQIFRKN